MEGDTEFRTSHVEACRREGVAASAYARQHGLTLASLYYWRRKLTRAATSGADGAAKQFVALRVLRDLPATKNVEDVDALPVRVMALANLIKRSSMVFTLATSTPIKTSTASSCSIVFDDFSLQEVPIVSDLRQQVSACPMWSALTLRASTWRSIPGVFSSHRSHASAMSILPLRRPFYINGDHLLLNPHLPSHAIYDTILTCLFSK